jgi:CRP-like cAMP-binding protein
MQTTKTSSQVFFQKINDYVNLTSEAQLAWFRLLQQKTYDKGDNFISEGQVPKQVAFVVKGLFAQYYTSANGDVVIKYFFPEHRIVGSVPAMLTKTKSYFTVTAIENSTILEYDFNEFKKLTEIYPDIAAFYIRYMEQHWIIEKEPLEISLRHDSAKIRYEEFLQKYPQLVKRLKKHHIASYLGITPTQLSRIFFANK